MQTPIIVQAKEDVLAEKKTVQSKWQRIVLLVILGYEGAGALFGGSLLVAATEDMPRALGS